MKAAGKKAVQAAGKAAKTQVEESQTPKDFKSTINPRDSFPKNHKGLINYKNIFFKFLIFISYSTNHYSCFSWSC